MVHPVAAIVMLAEQLAVEHGLGLTPPAGSPAARSFGCHRIDEPAAHRLALAQKALSLTERDTARLRTAAAEVLHLLRG